MPSPKTPLGRALQRALRQAMASSSFDPSRRRFLRQSSYAALSVATASVLGQSVARFDPHPPSVRIVIIGAGIAGLTAAYYLRRAGIRADIYEAGGRAGGRIFTGKNVIAPGIYTELGGEFIDSNHRDMHRLIRWFDLPLIDTRPLGKNLVASAFFAGGRLRTEKEVIDAFLPFAGQIQRDAAALPADISYQSPAASIPLDGMSIAAYLQRLGIDDWLFQLLDVAFTSEMGIDIAEQSALNFVTFINPDPRAGHFEIFGDSDERYKIRGGNQRVTDALAAQLDGQIQFDRPLRRLRQQADQTYTLSFDSGADVEADAVVLALPFTRLRHVELDLELPPAKKIAIAELGYGSNSKAFLGFNRRIWQEQRFSGYLFHPDAQNGWDSSQGQTGPAGGYSILLGGAAGRQFDRTAAAGFLPALDAAFPGMTAAFNGRSDGFNWPGQAHIQCSYSAYAVGQWTRIGGVEGEPVGNLFFAGEHCSREFQGYMNGGAQTGRLAAQAILQRLKRKMTPAKIAR